MKKFHLDWPIIGILGAIFVLIIFPTLVAAAPPTQDDDLQTQAYALYNEGFLLFHEGELQAALSKFEAALQLFQKIEDQSGQALCLPYIGITRY